MTFVRFLIFAHFWHCFHSSVCPQMGGPVSWRKCWTSTRDNSTWEPAFLCQTCRIWRNFNRKKRRDFVNRICQCSISRTTFLCFLLIVIRNSTFCVTDNYILEDHELSAYFRSIGNPSSIWISGTFMLRIRHIRL